jgi:hypothetical protein
MRRVRARIDRAPRPPETCARPPAGHSAPFEVAHAVLVSRRRREEMLEELAELRRRRDVDGKAVGELGAHLLCAAETRCATLEDAGRGAAGPVKPGLPRIPRDRPPSQRSRRRREILRAARHRRRREPAAPPPAHRAPPLVAASPAPPIGPLADRDPANANTLPPRDCTGRATRDGSPVAS